MEIYRNIPRPPRCRAAGTWPPDCRAAGANLQKKRKTNCGQVSANRPPGSQAAGPQGRPAAGRPAFFLQFSSFREIISHMCHFSNFLQK